MGLNSEDDISLRGLKICRECHELYMEMYTSIMADLSIDNLIELTQKNITILSREELENSEFRKYILSRARIKNVGILVPGEPMAATTHQTLRLEAIECGIEVGIIHSSSIFTAAPSLLGLHHYKFGRATSIPKVSENYFPLSPYETIEKNMKDGLHTLVLLDTQPPLSASEALEILTTMEKILGRNVITDSTLACVVSNAGSYKPIVHCNSVRNLRQIDFGPLPHTIVIPGRLHFTEAEALMKICRCPESLLEGYL